MLFKIYPHTGLVECLYTDKIDLHKLGTLEVERVSRIEYNKEKQGWDVIITHWPYSWGDIHFTFSSQTLGPFKNREDAKKAEVEYIEKELL